MLQRVRARAFDLQPFPGDPGHARRRVADLFEHLRRPGIVPVETDAARDLLDDPEILTRVARRIERLTAELHAPVRVGEGPGLLRERRCGQNHIRVARRLGEEDVLHHQMIELRQRLARVLDVRVRHRGVLAHDVHPADLAFVGALRDLGDGQADVRIELRVPERFELALGVLVVDALVVREHHRDQPHVRGALHVVLPAQRVQAGPRPADLSGDERQRDQAARVVGAVNVLRDPHPPEDDRRVRRRVEPRDFADRLRIDTGDRRNLLGRVVLDVLFERFVVLGAIADERLVGEAFLDDDVHQRVEQRDVGVGVELQEVRRVPRQVRALRVDIDELRSGLGGVLHERCGDGMVHRRIRADDDRHVGQRDVLDLVRDGARTDVFEQRGDRRGMAEPRAMVDVVRPEAGPHELLEQVGLFVAPLRRAEPGHRLRTVLVANLAQLSAREIERFFPRRFAERVPHLGRIHQRRRLRDAFLADHRFRQPLRVVHVVEAEPSLDAQPARVRRTVPSIDGEDLFVLDVVREQTADAAVRTRRVDLPVGFEHRDVVRRRERTGRTRLHALAARDARTRPHRVVEVEDDLRVLAAPGVADHVVDLLFAAGTHAAAALDAGVEVHRHRGVREIRRGLVPLRVARRRDAQLARPYVELGDELVRRGALLRHVRQQQLGDHLLRFRRAIARARHRHPLGGAAAARRREDAFAVDLDHADAAIPVGTIAVFVAQARDLDAVTIGGLQDRLVLVGCDRRAVEREADPRRHATPEPRGGSTCRRRDTGSARLDPGRRSTRPS